MINLLNISSVWWGNLEGKRPLERPRRRCLVNIKMDIQEVGCGCMDSIELVQDRNRWWEFGNAVIKFLVP
jgi:hypothetical protein